MLHGAFHLLAASLLPLLVPASRAVAQRPTTETRPPAAEHGSWRRIAFNAQPLTSVDQAFERERTTARASTRAGALVVRYLWDNACGDRWVGHARAHADTVLVRLANEAPRPPGYRRGDLVVRDCPGFVVPAVVAGEVTGLRPGRWTVAVELVHFAPPAKPGNRVLLTTVDVQ